MTDVERILRAIRGLSVRERVRLVERVMRDFADMPHSFADMPHSNEQEPAGILPRTTLDDLLGCVQYKGPARSLGDMQAGIARGAKKSR